jgi:hypothetical protein
VPVRTVALQSCWRLVRRCLLTLGAWNCLGLPCPRAASASNPVIDLQQGRRPEGLRVSVCCFTKRAIDSVSDGLLAVALNSFGTALSGSRSAQNGYALPDSIGYLSVDRFLSGTDLDVSRKPYDSLNRSLTATQRATPLAIHHLLSRGEPLVCNSVGMYAKHGYLDPSFAQVLSMEIWTHANLGRHASAWQRPASLS